MTRTDLEIAVRLGDVVLVSEESAQRSGTEKNWEWLIDDLVVDLK